MDKEIEKTFRDIDFTMTMENMPLTKQDKQRLRDCMTGKADIQDVLRETIARHSQKQDELWQNTCMHTGVMRTTVI